ncbi:hypothetical protein ES707_11413 [subsurface metagenome]
MLKAKEQARWRCHTVLKKYREGESVPYEVREIEGNALQAAGITEMWELIVGAASDPFNQANSTLEVYITDAYVEGVLDGASPETITGGKKWKAVWAGALGDGPWSKWKITNGTTDMNEKTEALGTKAGGTWTLEVSVTLS